MTQVNRKALYLSLGFENDSIPADVNREFPQVALRDRLGNIIPEWQSVTVIVLRSPGDRDRRVFVTCPHCIEAVPFGSLAQHWKSKRCEKRHKVEQTAIVTSYESERSVGKTSVGYMLVFVERYRAFATLHRLDGTTTGKIALPYDVDAHFQMIHTNASAFADWFNALEVMPVVPYLKRESQFEKWKAAFIEYATSIRYLDHLEYRFLSGEAFNMIKVGLSGTESPDELREIQRRAAKERKNMKRNHLEQVKREFPYLCD